ncbi:MAG: cyclic nucleotide-binding domain-containing protein [Deltaproteobacteria bacterium]|nr:cyclic nucleotide-binding domain-containing protein [Deltaproteobacteria bacterium]
MKRPQGPSNDGELDKLIAGFLSTIPLFAEVTAAEAMEVIRLLRRVDLAPGEVLFEKGGPPLAMWLLGEGCEVEVSVPRGAATRPVVLSTLEATQTVGEMALIDDSPRSATATVVRGGQAQRIEATDFEALRARFHPAAFKMIRRLASEMAGRLRTISRRIAPAAEVSPSLSGGGHAGAPLGMGAKVTPEALASVAQFKDLPSTVRLALAQKLQQHEVPEGAVLFRQGGPGDCLLVLLEGELALLRQGRTLARLAPGSMCGLVSAIDGGPRATDCQATTTARVLRLPRADLEWLFQSGNRFA